MIEEDEGHHPRDKRGMGYHGVKLQGFTKPLVPKHRISTAYSGVRHEDNRIIQFLNEDDIYN